MTGFNELPWAKLYEHGPVRDGETLAFLIEKLRPSIRAAIRQAIGQEICLIRLEQLIADSPEFAAKRNIIGEMMVIQTLCDRIQRDLSRT